MSYVKKTTGGVKLTPSPAGIGLKDWWFKTCYIWVRFKMYIKTDLKIKRKKNCHMLIFVKKKTIFGQKTDKFNRKRERKINKDKILIPWWKICLFFFRTLSSLICFNEVGMFSILISMKSFQITPKIQVNLVLWV